MPPRSKAQSNRRRAGPKHSTTGRAAGTRGGKPNRASGTAGNLILGFIAGLLVGVLATALWYEKNNSRSPVQEPIAVEDTSTAPATTPTDKPTPAGSEFYQQLPAAEVGTFSDKEAAEPLTAYLLQTGAFRARSEADEMQARIILETGMEAWIDERASSSGTLWYRVRLGPFEGKRASDRVKRQLWERARIEAVRYQYKPE